MRILYLAVLSLLAPLSLFSADMHLRFARVTLAEGRVDVEAAVTGERVPAERNVPVGEGYWVETGAGKAEVELDEGSAVRLGSGSLVEFSDLTRLSTGQRITLISVERGTLYASAEPVGLDAFLVVAPGLEITFLTGARVRVNVGEESSAVAVLEGRVRFSSRAAELEIQEGQTVQVHPEALDRFQLFREVAAAELDFWSQQRDKESGERAAGTKPAVFPFGLGELDAHGKWLDASGLGKVWQPRVPDGWIPFRQGRWRWLNELGYTWLSAESWGWLPYHYGRWAYLTPSGWVWAPGDARSFHGGETYWLRGSGFVGWGPLAPAEIVRPGSPPSLYSTANVTFAAYEPGSRAIDPARVPRLPLEPLKAAQFVAALPAPVPLPLSLTATQRKSRVGTTRILPITADQTYDPTARDQTPNGIRILGADPPPPLGSPPPLPANYTYMPPAAPVAPPEVVPVPAPTAAPPVYYPEPVYVPGFVVIERDRPHGGGGGRRHDPPASNLTPGPAASPPAPSPGHRIDDGPAHGRDRQSPPPKQEAPPPSSDGPDHKSRLRSPESGDTATRRR